MECLAAMTMASHFQHTNKWESESLQITATNILYLFCIRVQAEAEEVLEGKNGIDTIEDLKKLQYTQQVWYTFMKISRPSQLLSSHLKGLM